MGGEHWTPEEDALLEQYVGTYPAKKIADLMDRPIGGVHHRVKQLGLDGRIRGEKHWAVVIPDLTARAIHALSDAGFTPKEIHVLLTSGSEASYAAVRDIAAGVTRRMR